MPAELVVAGNWEVVEAMVGFVFISLQHQSIMKFIDALINLLKPSRKANHAPLHIKLLKGFIEGLWLILGSTNQPDGGVGSSTMTWIITWLIFDQSHLGGRWALR